MQGAGVILAHGFTSSPDEMAWLGDYLSQQGAAVYGLRLFGHGTHPRDLGRARLTDWVAGMEDGMAIVSGLANYIFFCGQSLGAMLVFLKAAELGQAAKTRTLQKHPTRPGDVQLAGVIGLATPLPQFNFMDRFTAQLGGAFKVLARKQGVKLDSNYGVRREANYPAYGAYAPRVILEIDRLSRVFYGSLSLVKAPALLIHPRSDQPFSPGPIEDIYRNLGSEKKELIWLENFEHSVVRDPRRTEVFDRVGHFIHTWNGHIPNP